MKVVVSFLAELCFVGYPLKIRWFGWDIGQARTVFLTQALCTTIFVIVEFNELKPSRVGFS